MIVTNINEMNDFQLRIRVAGERKVEVVDYAEGIVHDFPEDYERFGHYSRKEGVLVLHDAHARNEFLQWLDFDECVRRLETAYITLGMMDEEEAVEIAESEDIMSIPMPDRAQIIYARIMELVKDR